MTEDIEKNIKAIEEEKKEYLESKDVPSVEEDINTDVAPKGVPPHSVPGIPLRAQEPATQARTSDEVPSVDEDITLKSVPSTQEDINVEGNTKGKEHRENSSDENEEESENVAVDVTEIFLDDEEINEWIIKLKLLQASKEPVNLEIDDENELLINYEEGGEE